MEPIQKLVMLEEAVKGGPRMTMAVASGDGDPATVHAVVRGVLDGLIKVVLVGVQSKIERITRDLDSAFTRSVEIVNVEDEIQTARTAVQLVRDGKADLVMKGLISTDTFMKAVLDKEIGILPKGGLLSHVAVMQMPAYPKLLLVTDAAIIPNPTMDEKVQILNYAIEVAHSLGIEKPKAALVSAAEKINFKLQSSIDAAVIKAMAERKQIKGAIVDGPLALDVALSAENCRIKGLDSPINGEADILLFPNIETANTFYKSVTILAHGKSASILVGAKSPVVLSSRADDDDTKFYSIVMAARMASHRRLRTGAPAGGES
jgi:phosphate butyryltransferase